MDVPAALPSGDYFVELTLRGMEFNGAPELDITRLSDTNLIGSVRVAAALGDSWQRLLVSEQPITLNNPNETLKIELTNDAVGTFGLNRRVHIDKIDFYRAHKQPHANLDSDGDGLVDSAEVCYDGDCSGYDPYHPVNNPSGSDLDANTSDTDGDGSNDSAEIAQGTDPLNAQSTPASSAVAAPGVYSTFITPADAYSLLDRLPKGQNNMMTRLVLALCFFVSIPSTVHADPFYVRPLTTGNYGADDGNNYKRCLERIFRYRLEYSAGRQYALCLRNT